MSVCSLIYPRVLLDKKRVSFPIVYRNRVNSHRVGIEGCCEAYFCLYFAHLRSFEPSFSVTPAPGTSSSSYAPSSVLVSEVTPAVDFADESATTTSDFTMATFVLHFLGSFFLFRCGPYRRGPQQIRRVRRALSLRGVCYLSGALGPLSPETRTKDDFNKPFEYST